MNRNEINTAKNLDVLFNVEKNLYDDSYFSVVCWDRDNNKPVSYGIGSTAYSCDMSSMDTVDTNHPSRALYEEWQKSYKTMADLSYKAKSNDYRYGDTVTVTAGRKYPVGSKVTVLGIYDNQFSYGKKNAKIALSDGTIGYTDTENLSADGSYSKMIREAIHSIFFVARQGEPTKCIFDRCHYESGETNLFKLFYNRIITSTTKKEINKIYKERDAIK